MTTAENRLDIGIQNAAEPHPFGGVDFELPTGSGRLAAAKACGAACGAAWYAMYKDHPPAYRYPAPVCAWHHNLKTAWFDAYLDAWSTAAQRADVTSEPTAGLLESLPVEIDPTAAPT